GAANPQLTGTMIGLTKEDAISVNFTTIAGPDSKPGKYDIVPLFNDPGNRLANYNVITSLGSLTVVEVPSNKDRLPLTNLFGIDFVWIDKTVQGKGACVAVNELSW